MNRVQVTSIRVSHRSAHCWSRKAAIRQQKAKAGFTLVELLIVITVMLILITMTVVAIDFAFNAERIRSGARQVQSALEGARDRAIQNPDKEPRGLRLLVDPNEPRMVTSMVYVGAGSTWPPKPDVEHVWPQRPDFSPADGVPDSPQITILRFASDPSVPTPPVWHTLKERGYLPVFEDLNLNGQLDSGEDQNGNGILDRIAAQITIRGRTYSVLTHRLTATDPILELMPGTEFSDAPPPGTEAAVSPFEQGPPFPYTLSLPPRIMPDAQPILLPEGIVIDLDASQVPPNWRPGTPPPAMPLDQQYAKPYSMEMDIMFSPRGVVYGSLAAQGLVHLYLAERKDVVYAVDQGVTNSSFSAAWGVSCAPRRPPRCRHTNAPGAVPPGNPNLDTPLVPGADQFNPADAPIGDRLLISIFTQTGKVSVHQVNAADTLNNGTGAGGADGYADFPFSFAEQGKAQGQ